MKQQTWWVIKKKSGNILVDIDGHPWTWISKKELVKSKWLGPGDKAIRAKFVEADT